MSSAARSAARSSSTTTSIAKSRSASSPARGSMSGTRARSANPGDFFVSKMGEESVILTRDRAGQIHVFLNSCRHRGMKVCRYDEGNTRTLHLPLSRLELRSRRPPRRRAGLREQLPAAFRQGRMGPGRSGAAREFPRHDLGDMGQERAVLRGLSRRRRASRSTWALRPGTGATARPSSWAASRNGSCPATGNSSPRISPAISSTS